MNLLTIGMTEKQIEDANDLGVLLRCGDCYPVQQMMVPSLLAKHLQEVHGYTHSEVIEGMEARIEEAIQEEIDNEAAYQESYYYEPEGYR